ncbi:MAG: hypothetical protein FWE09_10180 [Treponema sp.]|nr:hypothetical protein [Treponema sp.]
MDDRKRQINEAEQRKKEQAALLDALFARMGEAIFERSEDSGADEISALRELGSCRRVQGEIAGAQDSIQAAEEQIQRLREIEEAIAAREKEQALCAKDMAGMNALLGRLILEDASSGGECAAFCADRLAQAEELLTKVQSLEERLAGIEQKEKGNVFAWIGKGAQSLVLRSFLSKAQDSLESLRRATGDRFSAQHPDGVAGEDSEISALCAEISGRRAEAQALASDAARLKAEKRGISDAFSAEGGPSRHIQGLKAHIAQAQGELKALYVKIGEDAALAKKALRKDEPAAKKGKAAKPESEEREEIVLSFLSAEDEGMLDEAARLSQAIRDCDEVIEKLKASLAIDEEKAKIAKCLRMIQEKRDRIAQAEKSISELEESIAEAERSIEQLRLLL